jgi:hypothetical protein
MAVARGKASTRSITTTSLTALRFDISARLTALQWLFGFMNLAESLFRFAQIFAVFTVRVRAIW